MPIQEKIGYAIILMDILLTLTWIITYIHVGRKYIGNKYDLKNMSKHEETEMLRKLKFVVLSMITAGIILPLAVFIWNTVYKDLYTMSFERFTEFLRTLLHTKINL